MSLLRRKNLLLLFAILLLATNLQASLTTSDHENMMKHLKIINDQGWIESSKNICNTIISRSQYNWIDWKEFFEDFYNENKPRKNLWNYLGYPAFYWFSDEVHYNIQRSNIEIYSEKIDSLFNRYHIYLATSMVQDSTLRESMFVYVRELAGIINKPKSLIEDEIKSAMIDSVEKWIDLYPKFFKKNRTTDPEMLPYVGYIRWQFASILIDYYELTNENIEHIINLLEIEGHYADIFRKHQIYIADNLFMKEKDLIFINQFMDLIPDTLTSHKYLSNRDYYRTDKQKQENIYRAKGAINTFSHIGGYNENSFPDDMIPKSIDGFSVVVAHETNHRVDPDFIYINPDWNSRRQEILEQAGIDDMQFLRGNAAYFQNAPQEFIASISNQWFTSSFHTVKHGIQRFNKGYKEPINQVLYFCDLYSVGGDTTRFYEIDLQGNIEMTKIPLGRNESGLITDLILPDTTYTFDIDNKGNVLGFSKSSTAIDEEQTSIEFLLYPNYPNPFNPETTINFSIPNNDLVKLTVFNILGNKVCTLIDNELMAGNHEIKFDAENLSSGIYFYKLEASGFASINKMLLQK